MIPLRTISAPQQYQHKILRSEFRCFLFPIASADEARRIISEHNKEYANATHSCFAYLCGFGQETQYYSDAGEPHGTAGKPILNALLRHDLTNVLAIVTRYFGGVKLGVKGLIEAYGGTVEETIKLAELTAAIPLIRLEISADYALVDFLSNKVLELEGRVLSSSWAERATLKLIIPASELQALLEYLDGFRQQSRLDYTLEET